MANRTRAWLNSARGGASRVAPTAPHATDPTPPKPPRDERGKAAEAAKSPKTTGPERFWDARRLRIGMTVAVLVSMGVHYIVSPWTLLPKGEAIELHDVADELTIPVDLLGEESVTPPEPKPSAPEVEDPASAEGPGGRDAGAKPKPDAGAKDAGVVDAAPSDGAPDAALVASDNTDGGAVAMLDSDAAASGLTGPDAGALAAAGSDAGASVPGAGGPRSPAEMLGMGSVVTAGEVNVTLLVNVAVIRQHPIGARMGPLLSGIPQWAEFIHGGETKFDPLQAADWILIFGPSLIHTDRDAVFVRYNVPDKQIDDAVDTVSRLSAARGGAFDAGVPGVHAAKTFADNGDRVMMRVQHGVLLVVPPQKAAEFAKVYRRAGIAPRLRPTEALRITVKDPWRQISIPGLKFPNTLTELRFWILPHNADGTADVYGEGDCGTPEHAVEVADGMHEMVNRFKGSLAGMFVGAATHGLVDAIQIEPVGDQVKLHLPATREQLDALLTLLAGQLGVNLPPAPQGAP